MDTPSPIVSGQDYLALPSAPETWIVEGLIPSGGAMLLYGDAKIGKSYAALQLCDAIARGTSWMSFPTVKPGKVVYVQFDTPRSLWQRRLRELAESGVDLTPIYQGDRETLAFPFDILKQDHHTLLRSSIMEIKPDVVVIDTIREAHDLDENDSTTMKRVVSSLISATMPAAMVLVAHSRKPSENGSDVINDNRGSNYLVGKVDSIVKLSARTLTYTGRAIESASLKVQRLPNYLWELQDNREAEEATKAIEEILADPGYKSQVEQVRELAIRLGLSEGAAKKRLQRFQKG